MSNSLTQKPSKLAGWVALLSVTLILCITSYFVRELFIFPNKPGPFTGPKKVELLISPGMKIAQVAEWIASKDLVNHPTWFRYYLREKMSGSPLKQGQYILSAKMTPKEIIETLLGNNTSSSVSLKIIEGDNMLDVSNNLESLEFCKKGEGLFWMRNKEFISSLQINAETLEGYLLADTHHFTKNYPCQKVISYLVKLTQNKLKKIIEQHPAQWSALTSKNIGSTGKFTPHDLLTMASLVEKETSTPKERVTIAGVFLNRLTLPSFTSHRLETDPTIKYGCILGIPQSEACKSFQNQIKRIHLQDKDNPYNTYTHSGLPKGPIANPSIASIKAVLEASQTSVPYLYFVSKNDKTHYFSTTFEEHNRAVDKYQRQKKPGK